MDAIASHFGGHFGAPEDDGSAILAHLAHVFCAEHVQILANLVAKRAASLQDGVHIGHLALDELEFTDAGAELLAIVDIRNHIVHHGLHDANWPGGEHGAFVIETAHQYLCTVVQAADDVVRWHFNVLKYHLACMRAAHAKLVELLRSRKAFHTFFYDEGGHATSAHFGLSLGIDHHGVSVWPVGDPHLAAVEQVVAAFVLSLEFHGDHVRARARFAHCECAHMLT